VPRLEPRQDRLQATNNVDSRCLACRDPQQEISPGDAFARSHFLTLEMEKEMSFKTNQP